MVSDPESGRRKQSSIALNVGKVFQLHSQGGWPSVKTQTLKGLDTLCAHPPHLHLSPGKSGSGSQALGLGSCKGRIKRGFCPLSPNPEVSTSGGRAGRLSSPCGWGSTLHSPAPFPHTPLLFKAFRLCPGLPSSPCRGGPHLDLPFPAVPTPPSKRTCSALPIPQACRSACKLIANQMD